MCAPTGPALCLDGGAVPSPRQAAAGQRLPLTDEEPALQGLRWPLPQAASHSGCPGDGPDGLCSPSRVRCHGGWDDHLCERVRVHCELPACEPAHRHRPPHAPELLTAPAAPLQRPHQLRTPGRARVPSHAPWYQSSPDQPPGRGDPPCLGLRPGIEEITFTVTSASCSWGPLPSARSSLCAWPRDQQGDRQAHSPSCLGNDWLTLPPSWMPSSRVWEAAALGRFWKCLHKVSLCPGVRGAVGPGAGQARGLVIWAQMALLLLPGWAESTGGQARECSGTSQELGAHLARPRWPCFSPSLPGGFFFFFFLVT